jgi:hypothetical protein
MEQFLIKGLGFLIKLSPGFSLQAFFKSRLDSRLIQALIPVVGSVI